MWICPGCNLKHLSCSLHVEHLEASPDCQKAAFAKSREPAGWQGMDISGPPRNKMGLILEAYSLDDTKN